MSRTAKISVAVGLVVVLAVAALVARTFLTLQAAPESQVVESVDFVSDGRSTIAIVPTADNQVLLIDSGMDDHAAKVLAELSSLGLTRESVTAILFTHGHLDHIGGARQFPAAERMALPSDAALIAGLAGSHGPVTRFFPVTPTGLKVDRVLQDGETVTVGQTKVKVFAIPGHTMGSAAYLVNGILFLGDSANATSSGALRSAIWLFSDDLRLNEASLRRLDHLLLDDASVVKAIGFGHSGVLKNGLQSLTEWTHAHE